MENINYAKIARSLVIVTQDPDLDEAGLAKAQANAQLARRYLSIRRRERVLLSHIRKAQKIRRARNPLHKIGFRAPLSVAGQGSECIVRAEALIHKGIPVALELDDKGGQRGMSVDEVQARLQERFEGEWTVARIFELYEQYIGTDQQPLALHSNRKLRNVGHLVQRLWILRNWLEKELCRIMLKDYYSNRFSAIVPVEELRAELERLASNESLLLGYTPATGLLMAGTPIGTVWGKGHGLAVVSRADLLKVAARARYAVLIECDRDKWTGYPDHTPNGRPEGCTEPAEAFEYFGAKP